MKYISNNSNNPYYNLALEEYILKNNDITDNYFILWQNEPTIVVGKYQNTLGEINQDYVKENNINVVRRITGGGSVYHDLGNINFSFITKYDEGHLLNFKKFTIPVVYALEKVKIKAELSGRNDILVGGKKISGNSQHIYKDRMLHHGTLLFDSKLDNVVKALHVENDKIVSKGIKSIRSRVTNIKDYLNRDITVEEFKKLLFQYIFEYDNSPIIEYKLSNNDISEIEKLMRSKYTTWDWNYGESPECNYINFKRFDGGKIEVSLNVINGYIRDCKICGDFLGTLDVCEIEKNIVGIRYERDDIDNFFSFVDVRKYFGTISMDQVKTCFIR